MGLKEFHSFGFAGSGFGVLCLANLRMITLLSFKEDVQRVLSVHVLLQALSAPPGEVTLPRLVAGSGFRI